MSVSADSADSPLITPRIYSPRTPAVRASLFARSAALGLSLICLSPLLVAALLTPDPAGLGTHTALGLPACSWPQSYGIPCPTCGMTTSWAWLARGNVLASLWIQPMGALLFVLAACGFWGGLYIAVSGRAAHHLLAYVPTWYTSGLLLILAILAWVWKIFIQLHGLDGWR